MIVEYLNLVLRKVPAKKNAGRSAHSSKGGMYILAMAYRDATTITGVQQYDLRQKWPTSYSLIILICFVLKIELKVLIFRIRANEIFVILKIPGNDFRRFSEFEQIYQFESTAAAVIIT